MRLVMCALFLLAACAPSLPAETWRITRPRVIAVRAIPSEISPGKDATFQALIVGPNGPVVGATPAWAACGARPSLAEPEPVAVTCLTDESDRLTPLDFGEQVTWTVAKDACSVFGPNPPTAKEGQPAGRPVDPDITGGWYLPIRVDGLTPSDDATVYRARLRCPLSGAGPEEAAHFVQGYRVNTPPDLAQLRVRRQSGQVETVDLTQPLKLAPGETVTWLAGFTDCGTAPTCGDGRCDVEERSTPEVEDPELLACPADCAKPLGCSGAERYLRFDISSSSLVVEREAVDITWYASAGELTVDRGRQVDVSPLAEFAAPWTAPVAGEAWLWVVLRDARGGVGWRGWRVLVGGGS